MAAGWHVMVYVEVLAHAVWIFVLFWSDLSVQLRGGPADGDDGFTTAESSYSIKLWDDNWLSLWYLWNLCVK